MQALNQARWQKLCDRVGLSAEADTFRQLQEKYAQTHRTYHNAGHINACLMHLDATRYPEAGNAYVEYALWFHDAIYNTFSSRNEERSANWAEEMLRKSGASAEATERVKSLIMATRHGVPPADAPRQPVNSDRNLDVLLASDRAIESLSRYSRQAALVSDIDLAILGAPPERFEEFERQIRAEYWWTPRNTYARRRAAVLRSFLVRPSIYATDEFRDRFEQQARTNLARLAARLSRAG